MRKKIISCLFIFSVILAFGDTNNINGVVDYRPTMIINLEKNISREKDRDKVAVLMKDYEKQFKNYLQQNSNNEALIFNLGDQYFKDGKYERARDIFASNPNSSRNLFGAGTTSRFIGDYNLAIDYYTSALNLQPLIVECYLGRGLSYRNIGEYNKAIEDLTRYKNMTGNESAYLALGDIYMAMGNYSKAKGILEEGRSKYPNSQEIKDMLVTIFSK